MKPSQVNKLYSKLTPHEQAALCVEASARQDRADFDAIAESVQKVTYQCVHDDFSQRLTKLYGLAGLYGTKYWKSRALMMTALHASDSLDGYEGFADVFAAKMASMNSALIEVCQLFKVDIEAVKILAQCKDEPTFDKYIDAKLAEQYEELFMEAVTFN
jgi:hypothetical protein